LSVVPAHDRPVFHLGQPFRLWGRHFIEHGSAFALVATAFAVGYRWSVGRLVLLAFLLCGAVELLQIPLPTRHARVSDFLIDFVAACLAIVLVKAFRPASAMVTR
jgi:VanZ family protein